METNKTEIGTTNQTAESSNGIRIFENAQFGQIRTALSASNEPLFCLADLCKALNITNNRNVRNRLDKEDVHQMDTLTNGGMQTMIYVSEPGMYEVILRSDSPKAKPFRKWVCGEILPSIRKNGGYMVAQPNETPEQIMARALILAQDTISRTKAQVEAAEKKTYLLQCQNDQQAQLITDQDKMIAVRDKHMQQMQPACTFAKAVETSSTSCLVGDLARIIKQNGVEIGQNRLFAWMRKNGFLIIRPGESYNLPTQKALNQGLFEIKKTVITKPDGTSLVTTTPKVTGKGQIFFVNRFIYIEANRKADECQRQIEQDRKEGKL